jgi:hypothetical protein
VTKLCSWGIPLVATLALLGVALAYPDASGPVSDREAAQLVGGATCYSCVYFNNVDCDDQVLCPGQCWNVDIPCGPQSWTTTIPCGNNAGCNTLYCGLVNCVVATAPPDTP